MAFWKRQQRMGWAALIMGSSVLLSRFAGLIRDKVISYYFGATPESDIYFAAFVIPDFINYLLAGAYFSITLIPLLAAAFEKNEEDGWHFFSAIFTWIATCSILLTGLAMIFAPTLARWAAPGLNPPAWVRLTLFLRIVLPAQVCFLLGACFMSLLYLRKQFLIPALTPLIYNFMIIAGGLLFRHKGMEGFCWGVLAGALAGNLLLPFLAASQKGTLPIRIVYKDPGLKRFFLLALPLMLGQSIVVLDEQLIRVFGSLAGPGAISWLNYARRIMLVPVGVVAQAAGVASYPFLAELAARKNLEQFHETLNTALQNTLFLLTPLSIWMMIVAKPTITIIFQQGHFAGSDTDRTTLLLIIFLAVVCCWGYQQIVGRGFYARQDTLTPAVLGTITTVCCLPLYYFGAQWLGVCGVALASASSITIYALLLSLRWRQRFGAAAFNGILNNLAKVLLFSFCAAIPSFTLYVMIWSASAYSIYWRSLSVLFASGLTFAVVFAGLSFRFTPTLIEPFYEKGLILLRKAIPKL